MAKSVERGLGGKEKKEEFKVNHLNIHQQEAYLETQKECTLEN